MVIVAPSIVLEIGTDTSPLSLPKTEVTDKASKAYVVVYVVLVIWVESQETLS